MKDRTVAIAGLGAVGLEVARLLDAGVEGLRLSAVACSTTESAAAKIAGFASAPRIACASDLAGADIVVEAMPARCFAEVALPVIDGGKTLVACSVGALLSQPAIIDRARKAGARIIAPTGAIAGLDAVRAIACEGGVRSVTLDSRKPAAALAGASYLTDRDIDAAAFPAPQLVFEGNAMEAAANFPANANVAAALALAGVGPIATTVRIWADPTIDRNVHSITVEGPAARLCVTVENVPSAANPRTSRLTALSVIACLTGLISPLRIGS